MNHYSSRDNHSSSSSSSSSNSSLSSSSSAPSPSSCDDDLKKDAVQLGKANNTYSKPVNGEKKEALQLKKSKANNKKRNRVTTPPTETDEQSTLDNSKGSEPSLSDKHVRFSNTPSPTPSPAPSPSKQVRFSEKVGKREIPSEDARESSSSSDSSRESSVDEQAHALLRSKIETSYVSSDHPWTCSVYFWVSSSVPTKSDYLQRAETIAKFPINGKQRREC